MKILGLVCLFFFCGEEEPDSACEKSFAAEKEQWKAEKESLLASLQEAEKSSAKFSRSGLEIEDGRSDADKLQEPDLRTIEKELAQGLEEILEFYKQQKWTIEKVEEESQVNLEMKDTRVIRQTIKQKVKKLQQIATMLQDVESANLYSGRWVQIPRGFDGRLTLDMRLIRRICWLVHVHLFWKYSPVRHLEVLWIKIWSLATKSSKFFYDFWMRFEADVYQCSLDYNSISAFYGRIQSFVDYWLSSLPIEWKQKGISACLVAELRTKSTGIWVSSKELAKLSSSVFTQFPDTWICIQKSVLNAISRVKTLTVSLSPGLIGSEVKLDGGTLEVVILCSLLMAFMSIISGFLHRFHILRRLLGSIWRVALRGWWKICRVGKLMTAFVSKITFSLVTVGIRILLFPFSTIRYMLVSLFRKTVDERQNEMVSPEAEAKGLSISLEMELKSSLPAPTVANIIAAFECEKRMQRWGTHRKRTKPKETKRKKAWSP